MTSITIAEAVPQPPARQRDPGHTGGREDEAGPRARGLILHDDMAMQRALGVILERCGYEVAVFAGFATEAVAVVGSLRPDAIIVDLALSGELGLQMIPAFLNVSPGCLLVVLSPLTNLREQARELGALALVDPRDLRHVEDWLLLGADPEHPC